MIPPRPRDCDVTQSQPSPRSLCTTKISPLSKLKEFIIIIIIIIITTINNNYNDDDDEIWSTNTHSHSHTLTHT